MNMGKEHPSFTRAKALPEPLRSLFPKSVMEANGWATTIRRTALAPTILVVANTRIECAWRAYIDSVPGMNHDIEWHSVLASGTTLPEEVALAIFPEFEGVPYAR